MSDSDSSVRYNTLMVLTHLILNDMVKVKGQVSHVVLCLCDTSEPIRDLAHLFFNKLAERSNNPIYNLLGDIIATLSRDRNAHHPSSSSSSATASGGASEQTGNHTTTSTSTTVVTDGQGVDGKLSVKTKPLLSVHSALTASRANQVTHPLNNPLNNPLNTPS